MSKKKTKGKLQSSRFGRPDRPFDHVGTAHTIVRVIEQLGYDLTDPEAFLRRAQLVDYGLSAEIEFAALIRWLGWCPLVHRFGEDVMQKKGASTWHVPDLLAIFEIEGRRFSTLIEVKTTKDPVLTLKKEYMQGLLSYAAQINQPLLIAWRPRQIGCWMLFDPTCAKPIGGHKLEIDFEIALKNDLMSVLAGDYYIVSKVGAGLRFEMQRISEKKTTPDGFEAVYQVKNAYVHDASGTKVENVPDPVLWAILPVMENKEEVDDKSIVQSFISSGNMTRAQVVLRTAVASFLNGGEKIEWKSVGKDFNSILKCDDLLREAQARFGTFFSYIFHQEPITFPDFLPPDWPGRKVRIGKG